MIIFALLSIAFANTYHQTTASNTGDVTIGGVEISNARDVCFQGDISSSIPGLDSAAQALGFSSGACPTTYNVLCNDASWTQAITGFGSISGSIKAKSFTDCEVMDSSTAVTTYYFLIGEANQGAFAKSTDITQRACAEAVLPNSCGSVDMTNIYTNTMDGVAGTCDRATYPTACSAMSNNAVLSNMGACGTATVDFYFTTSADCTSATDSANTAAASAASALTGNSDTYCTNEQGFDGMDCATAVDLIGCNVGVYRVCPASCPSQAGCDNSAGSLTIFLALFAAVVLSF